MRSFKGDERECIPSDAEFRHLIAAPEETNRTASKVSVNGALSSLVRLAEVPS